MLPALLYYGKHMMSISQQLKEQPLLGNEV